MRDKNNVENDILQLKSKYKVSTILHFSTDIIMVGFSTYGAITAAKNFTKAITEDHLNMMGIGHGLFSVLFTGATIYAGVCAYQEVKNYKHAMNLLNSYNDEKETSPKVLKR